MPAHPSYGFFNTQLIVGDKEERKARFKTLGLRSAVVLRNTFEDNESVFFQAVKELRQPLVQGVDLFSELISQQFSCFFNCPGSITRFPYKASKIIELDPVVRIFESGKDMFLEECGLIFWLKKNS